MKRKTVRKFSGYACISVGVLGLLLPILPGIPLLLVGLALLAENEEQRLAMKRKVDRGMHRSRAWIRLRWRRFRFI
ncbi:MAG: hypothetical protein ACYC46_12930 [Acidobacteriaceae bacterium]